MPIFFSLGQAYLIRELSGIFSTYASLHYCPRMFDIEIFSLQYCLWPEFALKPFGGQKDDVAEVYPIIRV